MIGNRNLYKLILFVSFCFFSLHESNGQSSAIELSENSQISLLTSRPSGNAVYTVFGHSALRVLDSQNNIDFVFNYGIFDFNSPNFIYRFTTGETDYMVVEQYYESYIPYYSQEGVEVIEQVIDLSTAEKQNIWEFLLNNVKPENRVYRYNIFYNNCTTILLDILEAKTAGAYIYPKLDNKNLSFRDHLNEHLVDYDWLKFGINLIMGANCDSIMNSRERMFLPIHAYNSLNSTSIFKTDGTQIKAVKSERIVNPQNNIERGDDGNIFTPLVVGFLILALTLISLYYWYYRDINLARIFPAILFIVAGIGGVIVFFMTFVSVHAGTGNNWNLIWINPLHIVAGILIFAKSVPKCLYYYHFINFALVVALLLATPFIPQQMQLEFIPYILSLLAVSAVCIMKYRKEKKQ